LVLTLIFFFACFATRRW